MSENIRVKSILGRFLGTQPHLLFPYGGKEVVYVGSADMMPRNLNRRVEILFPVENSKLVKRLRDDILQRYLDDKAGSWIMDSDGAFTRAAQLGSKAFDAQSWFLKHHGG